MDLLHFLTAALGVAAAAVLGLGLSRWLDDWRADRWGSAHADDFDRAIARRAAMQDRTEGRW
jgi:hypothetical protein